MNDMSASTDEFSAAGTKKPVIALMGEFSAGKSTLSNLLIGEEALRVQVTATQMPPVWISQGKGEPYRVTKDGQEEPVDLNQPVSLDDTLYVRVFGTSDILEICDIIDMPGISDPNMSPDVWQRVIGQADAVLWCSHATQAWRQSEAAVWMSMPAELYKNSLLLLTRFDKLVNERDKRRVVKRVERETQGLFAGLYPVSLLDAIAAQDDREKWEASGADAFTQALIEMIHRIDGGSRPSRPTSQRVGPPPLTVIDTESATQEGPKIVPRRVVRKARAPRPTV
ncbi:MAG: GTPase [Pseudomonadota bacterium]